MHYNKRDIKAAISTEAEKAGTGKKEKQGTFRKPKWVTFIDTLA